MMPRPRKHISVKEIAASALADKLPQAERDSLRANRVTADVVLALFTPDHIHLHTWGGSDLWWNLDMRRRGPDLKLKDSADTSRVAKAVRLDRINAESQRRLLAKHEGKPAEPKSRWPKRKMQSRPFRRRDANASVAE